MALAVSVLIKLVIVVACVAILTGIFTSMTSNSNLLLSGASQLNSNQIHVANASEIIQISNNDISVKNSVLGLQCAINSVASAQDSCDSGTIDYLKCPNGKLYGGICVEFNVATGQMCCTVTQWSGEASSPNSYIFEWLKTDDCERLIGEGTAKAVTDTSKCGSNPQITTAYVKGFTLPQQIQPTLIDTWISGIRDPKYLVYYEAFPEGEEKYWTVGFGSIAPLTLLMTAGMDIIIPAPAAAKDIVKAANRAALAGAKITFSDVKNALIDDSIVGFIKKFTGKQAAVETEEIVEGVVTKEMAQMARQGVLLEVVEEALEQEGLVNVAQTPEFKNYILQHANDDLDELSTSIDKYNSVSSVSNGGDNVRDAIVKYKDKIISAMKQGKAEGEQLTNEQILIYVEQQKALNILSAIVPDGDKLTSDQIKAALEEFSTGGKATLDSLSSILDSSNALSTDELKTLLLASKDLEKKDRIAIYGKVMNQDQFLSLFDSNFQNSATATGNKMADILKKSGTLDPFPEITQKTAITMGLLYVADTIESSNNKFKPQGKDSLVVMTPSTLFHDQNNYKPIYDLSPATNFLLQLSQDGNIKQRRLYFVSPCYANVYVSANYFDITLPYNIDQYDLYKAGDVMVPVKKGSIEYESPLVAEDDTKIYNVCPVFSDETLLSSNDKIKYDAAQDACTGENFNKNCKFNSVFCENNALSTKYDAFETSLKQRTNILNSLITFDVKSLKPDLSNFPADAFDQISCLFTGSPKGSSCPQNIISAAKDITGNCQSKAVTTQLVIDVSMRDQCTVAGLYYYAVGLYADSLFSDISTTDAYDYADLYYLADDSNFQNYLSIAKNYYSTLIPRFSKDSVSQDLMGDARSCLDNFDTCNSIDQGILSQLNPFSNSIIGYYKKIVTNSNGRFVGWTDFDYYLFYEYSSEDCGQINLIVPPAGNSINNDDYASCMVGYPYVIYNAPHGPGYDGMVPLYAFYDVKVEPNLGVLRPSVINFENYQKYVLPRREYLDNMINWLGDLQKQNINTPGGDFVSAQAYSSYSYALNEAKLKSLSYADLYTLKLYIESKMDASMEGFNAFNLDFSGGIDPANKNEQNAKNFLMMLWLETQRLMSQQVQVNDLSAVKLSPYDSVINPNWVKTLLNNNYGFSNVNLKLKSIDIDTYKNPTGSDANYCSQSYDLGTDVANNAVLGASFVLTGLSAAAGTATCAAFTGGLGTAAAFLCAKIPMAITNVAFAYVDASLEKTKKWPNSKETCSKVTNNELCSQLQGCYFSSSTSNFCTGSFCSSTAASYCQTCPTTCTDASIYGNNQLDKDNDPCSCTQQAQAAAQKSQYGYSCSDYNGDQTQCLSKSKCYWTGNFWIWQPKCVMCPQTQNALIVSDNSKLAEAAYKCGIGPSLSCDQIKDNVMCGAVPNCFYDKSCKSCSLFDCTNSNDATTKQKCGCLGK